MGRKVEWIWRKPKEEGEDNQKTYMKFSEA